MSKRDELREQRRRAHVRNQVLVILLVVAGALVITFGLIFSSKTPVTATLPPSGSGAANQAITPITPRTFNTTVDGTHLGDPNAPVKIDAWEDFQCPACRDYTENTEPSVIQNYVDTGKVYYTFHFYPFIDRGLPGGESHQAANAAMCALEQGRFWDYHDMLFANWSGENQGSFVISRLEAFAQTLGLDTTAFNTCLTANRYADQIQQDFVAGQGMGVTGTPSVFVNGTILTPGFIPSYSDVSQAVDAALSAGQ